MHNTQKSQFPSPLTLFKLYKPSREVEKSWWKERSDEQALSDIIVTSWALSKIFNQLSSKFFLFHVWLERLFQPHIEIFCTIYIISDSSESLLHHKILSSFSSSSFTRIFNGYNLTNTCSIIARGCSFIVS